MDRFKTAICATTATSVALLLLSGCAGKPKGEDFNLGVGIGMKLNAKQIEKRLKKSDPSASRVTYPDMPETKAPSLDVGAMETYDVGAVSVLFASTSGTGTIEAVTVSPSPRSMSSAMTMSAGSMSTLEQITHAMAEAAKRANASGTRVRTKKGIQVGSTESELKNAYGEPMIPSNQGKPTKTYAYEFDDALLTFTVAEGVVITMGVGSGYVADLTKELLRDNGMGQ